MAKDVDVLSEREKATLRLLLAGHDAKSIAREQALSVHSVNERLRAARQKLGVSSSREAARILGEAEGSVPNSVGDKQFGVAAAAPVGMTGKQGAGIPLAWLGGGMLIMSLFIAAAVLMSLQGGSAASEEAAAPAATSASQPETGASRTARTWLALVDGAEWSESWQQASSVFRAQVTAQQWEAAVTPVRQPLGAVTGRTLASTTATTELPGMPTGEYEVTEFRTRFAGSDPKTETVVLMREGGAWKVAGYFVR